ncbi:uncharacterized protein LOC112084501 [Eutrema salsugineum]|uniref:uncharacterized protein LOC112084501 n=1 Tax=Eutrema salsugineum TaxID=72664 RepID=UPI000CECEDAF|nr:uncharacterized protein LOC112084501 [Eutrema salsugineum]
MSPKHNFIGENAAMYQQLGEKGSEMENEEHRKKKWDELQSFPEDKRKPGVESQGKKVSVQGALLVALDSVLFASSGDPREVAQPGDSQSNSVSISDPISSSKVQCPTDASIFYVSPPPIYKIASGIGEKSLFIPARNLVASKQLLIHSSPLNSSHNMYGALESHETPTIPSVEVATPLVKSKPTIPSSSSNKNKKKQKSACGNAC